MNNVISIVHSARASIHPFPGLQSDQMLAELLILHEEMIVQLRYECVGVAGSTDFLTGMIAQHEKTAAMIRERLSHAEAPSTLPSNLPCIPESELASPASPPRSALSNR